MSRWAYTACFAAALASDLIVAGYVLAVGRGLLWAAVLLTFAFQWAALVKVAAVADGGPRQRLLLTACLGAGSACGTALALVLLARFFP